MLRLGAYQGHAHPQKPCETEARKLASEGPFITTADVRIEDLLAEIPPLEGLEERALLFARD